MAAGSYNPITDFSISNGNPNGVWSYGWMPNDFSIFNLYTGAHITSNTSSPQWYREPASADFSPTVWRNDSGSLWDGVAPGQLSLHPSSTFDPSVLRWTAPSDGLYNFAGQFLPGDGNPTIQVGIRQGSNWLWQGVDSGIFNFDRLMIAGGSIDFLVYGNYWMGNTPLELTITKTNSIDLPRTGQTTCYDSAGVVISCTGTGQDGEIQAGVPWTNPRFTDNANATVTDNLTGLMWTQDGNAPGPAVCSPATTKTWIDALDYATCLNTNNYLGYTNWRLPNYNELMSLPNRGQANTAVWLNTQGFNNVQSYYYWSSTTLARNTDYAFIVNMWDGGTDANSESYFYGIYVWPVRGGQVSTVSPCVQNTYYQDADNDIYGNPSITTQSCTQPAGFVSNNTDCNDSNSSINPTAAELCNGVDDNCNAQTDEGVSSTYYQDADSDTYGNASVTTQACTPPTGYVTNNTDCNDANVGVNPAATETCNNIDDNCNGWIDEGCPGVTDNTPPGTNVEIIPATDVTLSFDTVATSGSTTVTTSGTGQPPPSGFKIGNPPVYYEITSTATFSGLVEVCINYDENQFATEQRLKLFHMEGSWKDITTSLDTTANIICGNTTSFSPFIVAQQASTAVTLSNLSATANGDDVLLTWSTRSETDNEGFVVLRGENPNGPFSSVSSMIPAVGGLGMKAAYTFTDSSVEDGKTYYYRLQDVDSSGRVTEHKVVSVYAGSQKLEDRSKMQEVRSETSEARSEKAEVRSQTSETDRKAQASQQITSVVVAAQEMKEEKAELKENPPVSPFDKGGIQSPSLDVIEPRLATGPVSSADFSNNLKPSHFSVSLEDEKGNVVKISSPGADSISADADFQSLKVTEESGKVILSWLGKGILKGFILQRSERGKGKFTAISGLIPYFGKNAGDRFVYEFTDKEAKTRNQFEYRLETVTSHEPLARKGE